MAGAEGDFRKLVEDFKVGDLNFVKHNDTDFDSFREFNRTIEERYTAARKAKEGEAKRKNLVKWMEQIPERWRRASFRTFDATSVGGHQSSAEAAKRMLRAKQRGFFISGPHTSGKSYLAYAIIREFVAHGKLKPSQIRVITEADLIGLANGGYETREALDRVFDPRYKCYLFDSLGTRSSYDEKREAPALTKLIEEAYNRSSLFISTSHMDLDLYESGLPEQAAAKFRYMVKDGLIYTGKPLYAKSDPRRKESVDIDELNGCRKSPKPAPSIQIPTINYEHLISSLTTDFKKQLVIKMPSEDLTPDFFSSVDIDKMLETIKGDLAKNSASVARNLIEQLSTVKPPVIDWNELTKQLHSIKLDPLAGASSWRTSIKKLDE